MPWSLVLLLGGGFALAKATQVSGLSAWMGSQLAVLDFLDPRVLVLIVIIGTSFATEVTSNVATCSILLPVLRDLVSNGAPLVNALLQFASRNNQAACCARAHNLSCLFFVHLMLMEGEEGRDEGGGMASSAAAWPSAFLPSFLFRSLGGEPAAHDNRRQRLWHYWHSAS